MRNSPIHTVKPYALMLAPVYIYMKLNEKFVSVKAPLDFFTPEELKRLVPYESFFFPPFVDAAILFHDAARAVQRVLHWKPKDEGILSPASYEVSDAMLRILAPLWGGEISIEPFFVSVFVDELCGSLSGVLLLKAREMNVSTFELAILRSSWVVFLALHLGYCDLEYLRKIRIQSFTETMQGDGFGAIESGDLEEILSSACEMVRSRKTRRLEGALFNEGTDRVSQKMAARLNRIKTQLIPERTTLATIYGQTGFIDA